MPDRVISVPQATQIATRIKNKFDNVNGRLTQQESIVFTDGDAPNIGTTISGYYIGTDGIRYRESGKRIRRYDLSSTGRIHIIIPEGGTCVYQSTTALPGEESPSSTIVGTPFSGPADVIERIPAGATCVFISDVTDGNASVHYVIDIHEYANGIEKSVGRINNSFLLAENTINQQDTLYSFVANVGDTLTFTTSDGAAFATGTQITFYDSNGNKTGYYSRGKAKSPLTITYNPNSGKNAVYVGITSASETQQIHAVNRTTLKTMNIVTKSVVSEIDADCDFLSSALGVIPFTLEKGSLDMTEGNSSPTASAYNIDMRGRTPVTSPMHLSEGDTISIKAGYTGQFCYNAGQGLVKTNMGVSEYTVPADADVWFIIKQTTETTGTVIALETLIDQITVTTANTNSVIKRVIALEENEPDVPDYYVDHMAGKVAEINASTRYMNGVCFPFITDIHFKANSKNSKYLLKYILDKTACDFVVAGGDYGITRATAAESREIIGNLIDYASYIGHSRWFAINGNHDFTGTESLTWGETYNAIYRPSERWVIDGNVGGWFCIENPVQKTRIICLNSCCPSSFNSDTVMDGLVRIGYAQAKYLVDKLSDGDGYNIIVVSHIASDEAMSGYTSNMGIVQTILETFVAKSVGSSVASGQTLSYDFTSVTNSLIFHLSGHAHADESNVSNGVLSISTTCDAYYRDDGHGAAVGTVTEQAFDVYCIDYDAETITAVRVGRGASRKWSFDGTVLSDATD